MINVTFAGNIHLSQSVYVLQNYEGIIKPTLIHIDINLEDMHIASNKNGHTMIS